MRSIAIGPVEIIAEIGANHGASEESVLKLIRHAASAGATGIKIQLYRPESLTLPDISPGFVVDRKPWKGEALWSLYSKAALPRELIPAISKQCQRLKLDLVASVYSHEDVDYAAQCERDGVTWRALKIASFEANDPDLIHYAAKHGVPLMISTGMLTDIEIERAIAAAKFAPFLYLLHCVSAYPVLVSGANLSRIGNLYRHADMADRVIGVGYSDHTTSTVIPAIAASKGAMVIEKHIGPEVFFTTSENTPGLRQYYDTNFSLTPMQFTDMVAQIREAEAAGREVPVEEWQELRRSLYVVADVAKGEVFTSTNVRSIRPNRGLPPHQLPLVIGQRATHALKRGWALRSGDIDAEGFRASNETDDPLGR